MNKKDLIWRLSDIVYELTKSSTMSSDSHHRFHRLDEYSTPIINLRSIIRQLEKPESEMLELVNNVKYMGTKPDNTKGKILLTFLEGATEVVECDEFGISDGFPGFLVFWNNVPEQTVCLIQSSIVKKIETIE